jgi:error-prone DNA polymerase
MSRDIIPAEVREIIRRERDARGWTWTEIGRRAGVSLREIQGHGTRKTGFRRFIISRLAVCLRSRDLARLANSDLYWDKVVAIEAIGRLETYDLQIEGDHNFIADNLVVHNSHAASFALLAYVSAWLKHHEPAAFLAALLNSQPMGFYAASQLVQDARRHGVEVRDVDVRFSDWDCTLENECPPPFRGREREGVRGIRLTTDSFESGNSSALPVRLGLRMVKGLSAAGAARIITARNEAPFADADDLARRAALDSRDLEALAAAGALAGLAGHRHHAHWAVAGIEPELPLLNGAGVLEPTPILRRPTEGEEIVADYASLGLTLRRHPLALLRPQLAKKGYLSAAEVCALAHGDEVRTAGLVICRQHPASARGVIFVTIEDETGTVNLVVWQSVSARQRRELLHSRLLAVSGVVQREGEAATRPSLACGPHLSLIGEVLHVIAHRLADESALLGGLIARSRDFR